MKTMSSAVVTTLLASMTAFGGIEITNEFGTPISDAYYKLTWDGNSVTLEIEERYSNQAQEIWEVRGTQGVNIELIDIQAPSDNNVNTRLVVRVKSMDTDGVNNLVEIKQTGDELTIVNEVDVEGFIGSIIVDSIGDVRADGTIYGPITATYGPSGVVNVVESLFEDVLADITSPRNIGWIVALNGKIGLDANNPATIQSGFTIKTVKAKHIYADITATSSTIGDIFIVDATEGKFIGTINADDIQGNIGGNFLGLIGGATGIDADILLSGDLREPFTILEGDFPSNRRIEAAYLGDDGKITVGDHANGKIGNFFGDATFSLDVGAGSDITIANTLGGTITVGGSLNANLTVDGSATNGEGLTGQVIINANNTSGAWAGTATINSTDLSPTPYYNNKDVDVGGGAVGQVPYYLHYADSQPSGTKVNEGPDGHENGLSECALFPHHTFLLSG